MLNVGLTPRQFQETAGNPLGLHRFVHPDAPGGAGLRDEASTLVSSRRVRLDGKFFRLGDEKFWVKGVTYGPFAPRRRRRSSCPSPHQLAKRTCARSAASGANTVRVYHVPPREFLDTAHAFGLKVLVDVPWSKHRCFLDNREDRESGRARRARGGARLPRASRAARLSAS